MKTNKIIIGMFVFLVLVSFVSAGTIKGKVVDFETGEGIPSVAKILGTILGDMCDEEGNFEIFNVQTGEQIIEISLIGYKTKTFRIDVSEGINDVGIIKINSEPIEMLEIVVEGIHEDISYLELNNYAPLVDEFITIRINNKANEFFEGEEIEKLIVEARDLTTRDGGVCTTDIWSVNGNVECKAWREGSFEIILKAVTKDSESEIERVIINVGEAKPIINAEIYSPEVFGEKTKFREGETIEIYSGTYVKLDSRGSSISQYGEIKEAENIKWYFVEDNFGSDVESFLEDFVPPSNPDRTEKNLIKIFNSKELTNIYAVLDVHGEYTAIKIKIWPNEVVSISLEEPPTSTTPPASSQLGIIFQQDETTTSCLGISVNDYLNCRFGLITKKNPDVLSVAEHGFYENPKQIARSCYEKQGNQYVKYANKCVAGTNKIRSFFMDETQEKCDVRNILCGDGWHCEENEQGVAKCVVGGYVEEEILDEEVGEGNIVLEDPLLDFTHEELVNAVTKGYETIFNFGKDQSQKMPTLVFPYGPHADYTHFNRVGKKIPGGLDVGTSLSIIQGERELTRRANLVVDTDVSITERAIVSVANLDGRASVSPSIPILKHFPGGPAELEITENEFFTINPEFDGLKKMEKTYLKPFIDALKLQSKEEFGMMISHGIYPELEKDLKSVYNFPTFIDTENMPASLNPYIVKGLLRRRYGFQGYIIGDWYNMNSINQYVSSLGEHKYSGEVLVIILAIYAGVEYAPALGLLNENDFNDLEELYNENSEFKKLLDDLVFEKASLSARLFKLGNVDREELLNQLSVNYKILFIQNELSPEIIDPRYKSIIEEIADSRYEDIWDSSNKIHYWFRRAILSELYPKETITNENDGDYLNRNSQFQQTNSWENFGPIYDEVTAKKTGVSTGNLPTGIAETQEQEDYFQINNCNVFPFGYIKVNANKFNENFESSQQEFLFLETGAEENPKENFARFLEEVSPLIIEEYKKYETFGTKFYPGSCIAISKLVIKLMENYGLDAYEINGEFLKPNEPLQTHNFIVLNIGGVEYIVDYTTNQFTCPIETFEKDGDWIIQIKSGTDETTCDVLPVIIPTDKIKNCNDENTYSKIKIEDKPTIQDLRNHGVFELYGEINSRKDVEESSIIPQPERYSLISEEEATQTVLDATSYASAGISDVENSLITETIIAINFWEKGLEEWNKEYKTDYENWGDIQDLNEKEKVFDLMVVGIVNAETSYNKNNILAELFLYKMRSLGYGASDKYEQAIKAVENSEQLAGIEKWGVETGEEYVEAWEVEIILEKELKDFKLNLKQSTKDLLLDSLLKEPITKNIISNLGISGEEKISLILEFYVNAGFNKEEIINLLKKNEIETLVNLVENVNLLKHKDSRKGATLFFENISSNIEDATPLIPTINPLIYVLDDYYSFGNVRKTLNYLAENLEDKSLVITPLIKALKDDDLRIYAGFTLGDIALNIEETSIIINPLIESLKHKNSRKGATYALKEIADNLEDMAPLIPAINPIIEVLQYEDSREDATVAFRYIAPKLEGKDIREGFTIDFSNTLNKIYSQEQTKFFSRQLAVLINKMHDDEINNFGTDYIRETIAQNLNTRSIYYLISIGGADLYTSTFGKLYENMINNPNLRNEIKAIPDYEIYFVDFIIRLANFNKLKNVISLDEDFFYSGIEQSLQEQDEDGLIRNGALLVSTFENIFSGELGINAEKYENLLLDLYTEEDKTKQGVIGFLIKLNCDKFVCKTESMHIASKLPEISKLYIPQEWMNDGLITAKLYFFDDEKWFGITRTWLKQSGFTESDMKKQGDKLIESSLTKDKRKIIIHLMDSNNPDHEDVRIALNNPEIDMVVQRGHSYHLIGSRGVFIQEHSNSNINKLLYLGSCGSFGSTSLLQKWFPNAYFISDEDTGRGADNHRILLLLMEKIANGEREWIKITEEINVKVEGVTGIVYPDDKSMLLRRFINNL